MTTSCCQSHVDGNRSPAAAGTGAALLLLPGLDSVRSASTRTGQHRDDVSRRRRQLLLSRPRAPQPPCPTAALRYRPRSRPRQLRCRNQPRLRTPKVGARLDHSIRCKTYASLAGAFGGLILFQLLFLVGGAWVASTTATTTMRCDNGGDVSSLFHRVLDP